MKRRGWEKTPQASKMLPPPPAGLIMQAHIKKGMIYKTNLLLYKQAQVIQNMRHNCSK